MQNNFIEQRVQKILKIKQSMKLNTPIIRKNHDLVKNRLEKNFARLNDFPETNQQKIQKLSDTSLFDKQYIVGDRIGEGSDGVVRLCRNRSNDKIYAVKSMMMDDQQVYFLKKNFRIVKELRHESIVRYKALYLDLCKHISYLVMEYIPFPKLTKLEDSSKQNVLMPIFYQIFKTLEYLHQRNVCHRDIKPQNFLYDPITGKIKITDFGISKPMISRGQKKQLLTLTGTLYYRAPEMFFGGGYDERIDIWATGISLYKMLTGSTPFESDYHSDTIDNIIKGYTKYHQEKLKQNTRQVTNLIFLLLSARQKRITATQALQHQWFQPMKAKLKNFENQLIIKQSNQQFNINNTSYSNPQRKTSNNDSQQCSSPLIYFLNEIQQFPEEYLNQSKIQKDAEPFRFKKV